MDLHAVAARARSRSRAQRPSACRPLGLDGWFTRLLACWDPLVDRIRPWSFSSDGSRGEATWFPDNGSWIVRGTAVLPDGTQTSSINIYTFDGKDRCAWRVVRPALAADADPPTRATWVRDAGSTAP